MLLESILRNNSENAHSHMKIGKMPSTQNLIFLMFIRFSNSYQNFMKNGNLNVHKSTEIGTKTAKNTNNCVFKSKTNL